MKDDKKNIIITAGPTNERIDSVMKITNMSTGALGAIIADRIIEEEGERLENLYYISPKLVYKPQQKSDKLKLITVDSTIELLNELKNLLLNHNINGIVHSAAVGDYVGEYVTTGEILAEELSNKMANKKFSKESIYELVLSTIEHPESLTDNTGKISSYEKNLMVKLELTPKVIGHIKQFAPEVTLIGFKLLDGVSEEELYDVAVNLQKKNRADYIVANDLSKIGKGKHPAMFIKEDGSFERCTTKYDIAKKITKALFR